MPEFKPLNLAEIYQSADAAANQAMQTNLLTMQATKMRQDFQEEDALRNLAKNSTLNGPDGPSFDLKAFTKGAYGINPMKAIGYEKASAEAEKSALEKAKLVGEIDKTRMESAAARLKHMNDASSVPFLAYKEAIDAGMPDAEARAKAQPLYTSAITNLIKSGLFTPEQIQGFKMPEQFDPTLAEAGMRQVLGAKDSLAQYWESKKFGQATRGQDITMRGQDMTDARARETANQGWERLNLEREKAGQDKLGAPQEVTVDGKPMLASFDKTNKSWIDTNTGQPLANVSPKDVGGTGDERLASGFAQRMVAAEKIMDGLKTKDQKKGVAENIVGHIPVSGEIIANSLRGDERQMALQAQRDWVRAKLRKESGAAIGEKEMEDEVLTYFPQPSDGAKAVEQKKEARRIASEAMIQSAGRSYKPPTSPTEGKSKPAQTVTPAVQAERDGRAAELRAGEASADELKEQIAAYESALKGGMNGTAKQMVQRDLDLTKKALAIKTGAAAPAAPAPAGWSIKPKGGG